MRDALRMIRLHMTGACISMVVISVAAQAQQGPPQQPASTAVERISPTGPMPSRSTQTRSSSGGRESIVDVVEVHRLSGRLEPIQETRTETVRTGPATTRVNQDLYGFVEPRRPILLQRKQTDQETSADGSTRTIQRSWAPDVNGGLGPVIQQVESARTVTPDRSRSETTVLSLGTNGTLEGRERTEHTERRVGAGDVREETTQRLLRDLNGRWQPTETRSREVRGAGAGETIEEEVVERPDLSGRLTLTERSVTRRSRTNGRDDVVTETYAQEAQGYTASSAPLRLTRRVRSSTTTAADGGRSTVEEVEARSLVSPGDSLRVVQRTLVTVSRVGPNRWSTVRQVFELDVNGRMSLTATESEETTGQ